MESKCSLEVVKTHQFLESWLGGKTEKREIEFQRFRDSLTDDFTIVYPTGKIQDKKTLVADIWNSYGLRSPSFSIEIKNFQCRLTSDSLCVVTYEEWLHLDVSTGRICTTVFRILPEDQGLKWVLVHETRLSG